MVLSHRDDVLVWLLSSPIEAVSYMRGTGKAEVVFITAVVVWS